MNKEIFGQKMKSYARHPGSLVMMVLVMLSAIITFTILIFLIALTYFSSAVIFHDFNISVCGFKKSSQTILFDTIAHAKNSAYSFALCLIVQFLPLSFLILL